MRKRGARHLLFPRRRDVARRPPEAGTGHTRRRDPGSQPRTNNRGAFVPLSSLKYVLLDSHAPTGSVDIARYQRIAIHFVDHEVLRGYSDRQLRTSRYGVTLSLVSPDQSEVKDLAIPFTRPEGDLLPQDLGGRRTGDARVGLGAPDPGGAGTGGKSGAVRPGGQATAQDAVTREDPPAVARSPNNAIRSVSP